MKRFFAGRRLAKWATPVVFAAGFLLSTPQQMAYQDISSLIVGADFGGDRWKMFMNKSAAGAIAEAEVPFGVDPVVTGSIGPVGVRAPGIGEVSIGLTKMVTPETPDEDRINRSGKSGRVAAVAPVAPPKDFTAGSILQRQSSLLRPSLEDGVRMVFAKPEINKGDEIQIALAFHEYKETIPDPQMPTMLAELVTNPVPDILATAYAPVEKDFAKESPFETLLKKEDKSRGRFVPPIAEGDHAWAKKPLPAIAFSAPEQKCLAEGIYFEARGEAVAGQAAVAQVILNRVRNPTFPDTICGVVYQNKRWFNRCQFSFACDGIRDRINSRKNWEIAKDVALAVTSGKIWFEEVGSSTHYHATYVRPRWAKTMKKMTKIGLHVFYRTYGGGWS